MRLPRLSKRRPLRSAGEPRSRQRRARAWAASLACTAANRARSTIGTCSPRESRRLLGARATPPPTARPAAARSGPPPPPPAPPPLPRLSHPPRRLAAKPPPIEILRQRADRAKLEIAGKDLANRLRLGCDHNDLLVHRRIAERHRAADPNAFALGGSDLVAHPLPDQLAFELGKSQ